ncbi:flagellar protein FlaF [Rhodoplanes serenus]|uniref:Flagellar protein FlaF n=1 Tax=Rhodoplanes serenus TaxID=200615 RepID=A0A9X4XQQ6_9BRAD|nr:flagellar biosynthesis regulator FlaF [Rhodoplanes serenus]MTW18699.1 flagellar protein FlaF [Rhodoplanes serenus]
MRSAATSSPSGSPATPPPDLAPDLGAHLLLDSARRLQAVQRRWDGSRDEIDAALSYNRRLWSDLVDTVCTRQPTLPTEVRQSIASLGLFVDHRTVAIAADPRPEHLTALIGLNRDIAAGLLGRA